MISVIVPIYNAAKYLRRCVESILSQTFTDYELILVDDGSVDDSPTICDDYAKKITNIVVIHQTNKGASVARNMGMNAASGDLVCFVDADDSVDADYLKNLYDSYLVSSADLIIHGLRKNDGRLIVPNCNALYKGDNLKSFFIDNDIFSIGGPCGKLFRRDILSMNMRFDENIIYGEDICFLLMYLKYCTSICTSQIVDYVYYTNEDSVSSRIYTFENEYNSFKTIRLAIEDLYIDDVAKSAMCKSVGYMIYRTIISNAKTLNRKNRICNYNSYTNEDIIFASKYFVARTVNMKVVRHLFVHKMFFVLDLYLSVLMKNR